MGMGNTVRRAILALAMASAGCGSTGIGPDMTGLSVPVLVGPVHRIGGGRADVGSRVQEVEGEASQTIVASSSTQDYGSYTVTTTRTSTLTSDTVAAGISAAAVGVPGCVVLVKDLKAAQHYHISLFAWGSRYVWIQSEVWRPATGGGGR